VLVIINICMLSSNHNRLSFLVDWLCSVLNILLTRKRQKERLNCLLYLSNFKLVVSNIKEFFSAVAVPLNSGFAF